MTDDRVATCIRMPPDIHKQMKADAHRLGLNLTAYIMHLYELNRFKRQLPDFKCEACGKMRPFHDIAVLKMDWSIDRDLPKGTCTRNVNYCRDKKICKNKAWAIGTKGMKKGLVEWEGS